MNTPERQERELQSKVFYNKGLAVAALSGAVVCIVATAYVLALVALAAAAFAGLAIRQERRKLHALRSREGGTNPRHLE